jgi:hypothetical protein
VGGGDGGGYGKADSGAPGTAAPGFIGTVETFKDMGYLVFGYAYAGVGNGGFPGRARLFPYGNGYAAPVGVFHRIGQEIYKYLFQPVIIAVYGAFHKLKAQVYSFFAGPLKKLFRGGLYQPCKIKIRFIQSAGYREGGSFTGNSGTPFKAGKYIQILDQIAKPYYFFMAAFKMFPVRLVHAVNHGLDVSLQAGEGRTQFMGYVGAQLPLTAFPFFQFSGQFIDSAGEFPEFPCFIVIVYPDDQPLRVGSARICGPRGMDLGYAPGRFSRFKHRLCYAPGKPERNKSA